MSEKINTQDLARLLADKHELSKENADLFVKEFFQLIQEVLIDSKYVKVKGLGTFKLIEVESRESVNVNTGKRFEIQGHTKVSFTPDPSLRDQINRPFAHFETVPLQNEDLLETTPVEDEEPLESDEKVMEEVVPTITEPINETETTVEVEPVSTTVMPEMEMPVAEAEEKTDEIASAEETNDTERVQEESEEEIEQKEPDEENVPERLDEENGQERSDEEIVPERHDEESGQETVSDAETATLTPEEAKERAKTMKYFIGIVFFIILLCVAVLVLLYVPSITRAIYGIKPPTEQPVVEEPQQQPVIRTDTLSKDTVVAVPEPVKVEPEVTPAISTFQPDSSGYEIVGTQESHTVKEGETLTRISLHYWGTKALWPYLVKHNSTVIKNPDNVPFGTTIQIPKLKKK